MLATSTSGVKQRIWCGEDTEHASDGGSSGNGIIIKRHTESHGEVLSVHKNTKFNKQYLNNLRSHTTLT